MRRAILAAAAVFAAVVLAPPAVAQPAPPPNPSDQDLAASRDAVVSRSTELGRLSGLVADLDRRAADARAVLADRREEAFQRLTEWQAAQDAAESARRSAEAARVTTTAAGTAVDGAQRRLDDFAAATYLGSLDLGPLGLLSGSSSPEELVARAEFGAVVGQEQTRAIDGLQRAFVDRVNAQSTARAAVDEARAGRDRAEQARVAADAAAEQAQNGVDEQQARLDELDVQRAAVQTQVDALRAGDQRLQEQRMAYESYRQRAAREAEEERRRAERALSAADASPGTGRAAAAALGPQYACRFGTPRWGPVKAWVGAAGQLLRCRFGILSVGGVGPRARASEHPLGLALDFFVDRPTGDALAECALRNRGALAVKYVIFRQRINSGSGWRQMADRGSPVENHMEHVHISFEPSPGGDLGSVSC